MAKKAGKIQEVGKGVCRVCGGDIVEKIVHEFNPRSGPLIIGPASKEQFHDIHEGYYCNKCGLKYEFVPKIGISDELRERCLDSLTKLAIQNGVDKKKARYFIEKALSLTMTGDISKFEELCKEYGMKGPTWPPTGLAGIVQSPFRKDGSGIDIYKSQ